jgi:hypothetical protein
MYIIIKEKDAYGVFKNIELAEEYNDEEFDSAGMIVPLDNSGFNIYCVIIYDGTATGFINKKEANAYNTKKFSDRGEFMRLKRAVYHF